MRPQTLAACSALLVASVNIAAAQTQTPATGGNENVRVNLVPAPAPGNTTTASPARVDPFFTFSDTTIGYRYQPLSKEPAVRQPNAPRGADITKNIVNLSHADTYRYGANFVNLDILKSSAPDLDRERQDGAWEAYFIYRGKLSPNSIFNTTAFTFGPIRDINFEIGFDHSTKNTAFGAYKWLFVVGPNISFNVPGFLNLGIHYAKEWNHNGIVGRYVHFDNTLELELVYGFPLAFTGLPLRIEGFTNYITPKGRDGFGVRTSTEILSQNRLTLDLGALLLNKPRILDVSAGFQYWYNKFGNNHSRTAGAIERAPFFATRLHF